MRHKESLCRLEVFGCQFLTPSCLQTVYEVCPGLQHLNIGQVPKVNAHCLAVMTLQLKCLISLNVTGLQANCVKLQSLTFSSCPGVTDMTLHRISKYTTCIRSLDVSGCKAVTDAGVQSLALRCRRLQQLDLSSTGTGNRGVTLLANYCSRHLCTVKLSFCHITSESILKLCRRCKRLKVLHLYGSAHLPSEREIREPHPSIKGMSSEEQDRLRSLFHAYDADNSGRIERSEFLTICAELQVSAAEADRIFNRLDVDQDGTVTLLEFINGFHDRHGGDMESDRGDVSDAWEHFERRMGEQAKFIPRHEQASTLYHNVSLTEPRLIPQLENVIMNFTKEIKQQNSEMENLALAIKRAQDQASMQLSEMEEEMEHRIHAAERKTRDQERKQTEAALSELRRSYETEVCELQCKIQRMQMIEEKYNDITGKDESQALKKKISELTLDNQKVETGVAKVSDQSRLSA
ncbi:Ras and EF-hand domain-containing protein Ras-related protein Rab-45 [Larimichthys crocea]|uniref:Ras and EF-hand domain-containing protein Ras-related protein Rab-45 n=1 Tax=Larimichthys crocea TaxID=215358 RepID=A0A6G0IL34_LARCR|nr:Ras and EF-hand domain-containing protein Ras-related protein Rab-45 [Larimichthys crocea]